MEKGFEIKSSKIPITHPHVTDGSYQVYLTYDAEGEDHGDKQDNAEETEKKQGCIQRPKVRSQFF